MIELFKNRLKKYLAPFVVLNDILLAIITAAAGRFDEIMTEISALKDSYYTGKGLIQSLKEHHIYFSETESESDLQDKYKRRFEILCKRGTEQGVIDDIRTKSENPAAAVSFYGPNETGFILGTTFLGDDQSFLGVSKLITTDVPLRENEKRIIIPIDCELLQV